MSSGSILTEEWWVDFVAGWVSGAVGVATCQPLDTVLTRFQAGQGAGAFAAAAATSTTSSGSGIIDASAVRGNLRGLVHEFGPRSLWRGSSPMIGAVPIQNALLMGGYGFGKRYASENDASNGNGINNSSSNANANANANGSLLPVFVGGCVGGVLQSFFMSPVEWIKVNQQTALGTTNGNAGASSSSSSVLRKFVQHRGALWNRGLAATLLRDGIPHGVWFASYECCKIQMLLGTDTGDGTTTTTMANEDENSTPSSSSFYKTVTVPVVSGAFAATTAWSVGYPFDVIKTRIQASAHTVPGVYETGRHLVREANGSVLRGLYRGFGLKLVRSVPASMVGFFCYEFVSGSIGSVAATNSK